jgi:hypothetical protein
MTTAKMFGGRSRIARTASDGRGSEIAGLVIQNLPPDDAGATLDRRDYRLYA